MPPRHNAGLAGSMQLNLSKSKLVGINMPNSMIQAAAASIGCGIGTWPLKYLRMLLGRGQAEKEFRVEVEAIGRVRHKNLVRLLGYCMEGAYRMLVYEYIDNGNLEQWLHGDVGLVSPLTWEIRMNIILGTAKGYDNLDL
ncbi:hypothetical protein Syun_028297 [Stephania yunnanensis]|uniref:Protein kinase domain-containing protein n=2 Tax=Stephania yunnanensis TaxID=152371 RepID=A0AAP0EH39_9MAGN